MTDVLLLKNDAGVMWLTLNRPKQMNALDTKLIESLGSAISKAGRDESVRVVALVANGEAFSAGADLAEVGRITADADAFRQWLENLKRALVAIESCPRPVVAGVTGVCFAGGLELALACDLIVASDQARFGDVHARFGLVPGGGGSVRLPEAIGRRAARWLMYSGDIVGATEALGLGLVQRVLAAEDFAEEFSRLVGGLARRSPEALRVMKKMTGSSLDRGARMDAEIDDAVEVVLGPEAQEGLSAFLEKREPDFGP